MMEKVTDTERPEHPSRILAHQGLAPLRPGVGREGMQLCRAAGREPGRWRASPGQSAGGIRLLFWSLFSSAALAKFRCTDSEAFLLAQDKKLLLPLCFCLQSMHQRTSAGPAVVAQDVFVPGFLCKEEQSLLLTEGLLQPLARRPGDARSSASICLPRTWSLNPPGAWAACKLLCAAARDAPLGPFSAFPAATKRRQRRGPRARGGWRGPP